MVRETLSTIAWLGFIVGLCGLAGIFATGLLGSECGKAFAKFVFFIGFVPMWTALAAWMIVHHFGLFK